MSANSQFTVMVHILTVLAAAPFPVSSAAIADSVNTNPVTIRKAIGKLRAAGLVETIPGSNGGAILRKGANQIKLADVYQIVKENSIFGLHVNTPNQNCPVGGKIERVLNNVYDSTEQYLIESLSTKTIHDILEEIKAA